MEKIALEENSGKLIQLCPEFLKYMRWWEGMDGIALSAVDVSKTFRTKSSTIRAVNNVNLQLEEEQFMGCWDLMGLVRQR